MEYVLLVVVLPALIGLLAGWKLSDARAVMVGGAVPALGWLVDLVYDLNRPRHDSTLWWVVGAVFVALPAICIGAGTAWFVAAHRHRVAPPPPTAASHRGAGGVL